MEKAKAETWAEGVESEVKTEAEKVITNPVFDEKEFCEKEILPLARELHKKCAARNIPLFCAVCMAKNETDDRVSQFLQVGTCFPGQRTPMTFHVAKDIVNLQEINPLLLGLFASLVKRAGQN